jgi:hypothetical protein
MSNTFINVHTYDGKLKDLFKPVRSYTIEEKRDNFSHLVQLLTNPAAIATVQIMIKDLDQPNGSNFHPENNVDSSDILMELIQWISNPDVLKALNEQLADTRNLGICNSGRVTRLLQLWLAFVDYEDKKEKKNNVDEE